MKLLTQLVLVAGLFVLAAGCSGKHTTYSEFMGAYDSQGATPEFVYVASGVDFSAYDRVMVDYLVVFMAENSKYRGIQADELNEAALAFHRCVIDRLSPDFSQVARPGPGVLRIRPALTQVSFSRPESRSITSVFPGKTAVAVRKIPGNSHFSLEKAAMEIEFLDAMTHQRLALAVVPCPRPETAGRLRWEVLTQTFERLAGALAQKLGSLKPSLAKQTG